MADNVFAPIQAALAQQSQNLLTLYGLKQRDEELKRRNELYELEKTKTIAELEGVEGERAAARDIAKLDINDPDFYAKAGASLASRGSAAKALQYFERGTLAKAERDKNTIAMWDAGKNLLDMVYKERNANGKESATNLVRMAKDGMKNLFGWIDETKLNLDKPGIIEYDLGDRGTLVYNPAFGDKPIKIESKKEAALGIQAKEEDIKYKRQLTSESAAREQKTREAASGDLSDKDLIKAKSRIRAKYDTDARLIYDKYLASRNQRYQGKEALDEKEKEKLDASYREQKERLARAYVEAIHEVETSAGKTPSDLSDFLRQNADIEGGIQAPQPETGGKPKRQKVGNAWWDPATNKYYTTESD